MGTFFILIPLLLILVTIVYGVAQVLVRAWLDYRVRIALLEKLEKNPGLLGPQNDVATLMAGLATACTGAPRQNYGVTGLVLAAIGIACVVGGRLLRSGELAVGTYLGGVFCVFLGLVIALLGFIIHIMLRPAKSTTRAQG